MKGSTKVNFFLIIVCMILAALLPGLAITAFGLMGGILLCIYALVFIVSLLGDKNE
jgi:hypothetical protein